MSWQIRQDTNTRYYLSKEDGLAWGPILYKKYLYSKKDRATLP
jgi:hypothetical protein